MHAVQSLSLPIKPETFCDATRTRYEAKQLYNGSSVNGKSIASAFSMKIHRYRSCLCDLFENWKCKYKGCAFVIIMSTKKQKAFHLLHVHMFYFFLASCIFNFAKGFSYLLVYLYAKKIDLLPNPTSGLLGMHYMILHPYRY